MHIPDGFLDAKTALVCGGLSLAGLGVALRQARRHMPPRRVPLMGVSAAFIFAAQMLNFPVAGGTSGHLVGGVLAAVLLGPSAAIIVLAAVLIVQCFVFGDGGVTALGANIFNMGLVSAGGGYFLYRAMTRILPGPGVRGRIAAAAFASWCATVIAAIACAGELAMSSRVPWGVVFPAMAGVHMLIGIGEALITCLIVLAIERARPELIEGAHTLRPQTGRGLEWAVFGTLIALGLAIFVSPFACKWPDGLEKIAGKLGLGAHAAAPLAAPIADYKLPGIGSLTVATSVAGAIGTVAALFLGLLLAYVLVPKPRPVPAASPKTPT